MESLALTAHLLQGNGHVERVFRRDGKSSERSKSKAPLM